jgi:DNA-binding transcriptional MerR regulator
MAKARKKGGESTMSLSEVARRTGISMPTLLRYKQLHAKEIPSEGEGRTQRYPKEALAVFSGIKQRNLSSRGPVPRRAGAAQRAGGERGGESAGELISLSEVGRLTGISYPTLLRYVKFHLAELPHQGSGRTRRFAPAAVEVFARLRRESRRGRKPSVEKLGLSGGSATTLLKRLDRLERAQSEIARQLRAVLKSIERPIRVSVQR